MNRGSYKIQEGFSGDGGVKGRKGASTGDYVWCEGASRPVDTSYSSFLLSILFFLALCVVIMLAAWPWGASKPHHSTPHADDDRPVNEGYSGGKTTPAPRKGQTTPIGTPEDTTRPPIPRSSTTERGDEEGTSRRSSKGWGPTDGDSTTEGGGEETELVGGQTESGSHLPIRLGVDSTTPATVTKTTEDSPTSASAWPSGVSKGVLPGETTTSAREEDDTCWTPACKADASRMLALMNHSAHPCQDLYAFACGGMRAEGGQWIAEEKTERKAEGRILEIMQKINSSWPTSLQKFKGFFDKCRNYEQSVDIKTRLEIAKNIIKGVGKFHFDNSEVGKSIELLGNLLSHNFSPILDILLEIDSVDPSKFVLKLTAPQLKSPFGQQSGEDATLSGWNRATCMRRATATPKDGRKEDDFNVRYKDYTKCNNDLSKYAEEVEVALRSLKLFVDMDEHNETLFIKDIVSTVQWDLLTKMQKILPSQAEKNIAILEKNFTEYTVAELQRDFSRLEWNVLLSKLIGGDVAEDVRVHLYFKSYFKSVFEALDQMEERKQINGLLAMFAHEVYYGLVVNRNSCSRDEYCLAVSSDLMPEAASALFLRSFHSDQLSTFQSQINTIFQQLILHLKSEVNDIVWLKGYSKDDALEKVSRMQVISDGGASLFLNDTYLDKQFEEYHLNSTYLEDAVSLMQRFRKKIYLSYKGNPMAPDQIWFHFATSYSINGKAIYGRNTIVIPYGVMLQPFIREDSPTYLKMAALGNLIAREIWHHFDKTGVNFISDGRKDDLFSSSPMQSVRSVERCLEDQYGDKHSITTDDGTTLHFQLQGFVSTNSRLSDIGGSYLAFTSMRANDLSARLPWLSMTAEQLYFLAIAQSKCTKASPYQFAVSIFEDEDFPPFLRVTDIAQNSKEFTEAFSCPIEHRCSPFTLAPEAKVNNVQIPS